MITWYIFREQRPSRLKERSVKHLRIVDKKTLYAIYEFKEEIGHGSYGTVISAIEKQTCRNYAIKIVNKFTVNRVPKYFPSSILISDSRQGQVSCKKFILK